MDYEKKLKAAKTVNELCAALSEYCNAKGETALMGAARYCEAVGHMRKRGVALKFNVEEGKRVYITAEKIGKAVAA